MERSYYEAITRSHNRQILATPIGRRAMLALGARGAMSLCAALGSGAALSLFGSLSGCYRAPGTARDQVIFFSEEKELEYGVSAYRQVLRLHRSVTIRK